MEPHFNVSGNASADAKIDSADIHQKTVIDNLNLTLIHDTNTQKTEILSKGIFQRIGDDLTTFGRETVEPEHRLRRIGSAALGIATQALDRGRVVVFLVPAAFDRSLQYANEHGFNGVETATLAGAAAGGVFGAWSWIAGRSFHSAINNYPKLTEKVTTNHPAMVQVVGKAVGGFVSAEELATKQPDAHGTYDVKPYEARKNIFSKAALAISRGYKSSLLYGMTAYVGLAKVKRYSDRSNERLRRAVTVESAGAIGSIAVAVSAAVTNNAFHAAEQIRDAVTNKPALLLTSAGFIGYSAAANWLSRKSEKEVIISESILEPEAARRKAMIKAVDS